MEKRGFRGSGSGGKGGSVFFFFFACGVFHDTTDITDGGRESVSG